MPLKMFISSTSADLHDYRNAIIEHLFYMGHPMSVMEHFGSRSDRAGPVSEAEVKDSDILIGIYAFRYGHVPDEESGARGPSITEREFDTARALGLRCLCYFADESLEGEFASGFSGEPEWKQKKLQEFKDRIDKALVRASFTSPDDLKAKVGTDLNRLLAGDPLGYSYEQIRREWERYRRDELALLSIEIENRPLDLLKSPLAEIWSSFIRSAPWHERIAGDLSTIAQIANRHIASLPVLIDCIHGVDCEARYPTVLRDLRNFESNQIDNELRRLAEMPRDRRARLRNIQEYNPAHESSEVRQLRRFVGRLRREAINPHFGQCFLVMGGLGSGKSHFIASLFDSASNQAQAICFLLMLRQPFGVPVLDDRQFESMIVDAIQLATRTPGWRSLAEFARFIEESRKGCPTTERVKLVIVIDEVGRWISSYPGFLEMLTRFVQAHTDIRCLHWLMTIQTAEHERISDSREASWFWSAYGFNRHYRVERQSWDHQLHFTQRPDPAVAGWLVLEDLNRLVDLGTELLCRGLERQSVETSTVREMLHENPAASRHLVLPFVVWVFLDAREQFEWRTLVNLNFIEFVELFWKRTTGALGSLARDTFDQLKITKSVPELLNAAVVLIAERLTKSREIAPLLGDIVKAVAAAAAARADLTLERLNVVEATLSVLERGNLVKRVHAQSEIDGWRPERLELRFELFWEYLLARQLAGRIEHGEESYDISRAREELEAWFTDVGILALQEGTYEFLLLILEKQMIPEPKNIGSQFLVELCTLGMGSEKLPVASIWFAGAKASPKLQNTMLPGLPQSFADFLRHRLAGQ